MKSFAKRLVAGCALALLATACGAPKHVESNSVSVTQEWQTEDVRVSVDMLSYCQRKFGQGFSAVDTGSGNWICESDPHNTRPISVVEACTWQQNTNRVVFDQSAEAWYCVVTKQVWVPVDVGVNLDAYCKRQYGQTFTATLIGSTVGDWVCQDNPDDRRPVDVKQACLWQQGTSTVGYTSVNDPYSWYCVK